MEERVDAGRLIAKVLRASGIDTVFCLQGGHIDPILYGCLDEGIRIIDTRHEQAAAHMAEGWGLATGQTGVCIVTAGPGLSDAVTGLANAYMSASPMLCLAGARPLAQADTWPLQDLDQLGIVRPITKWARSCATPERAGEYTAIALAEARSGRPGPVYLDVPYDLVQRKVPVPDPLPATVAVAPAGPDPTALDQALRLLQDAERPIVIVGSGAHWSGAGDALAHLTETAGLPVFALNAGRGQLPDTHPWSFGAPAPVAGSAFMHALGADVVLALGIRFGFPLANGGLFAGKKVIRVDLDAAETTRNRPGDVNLVADVRVFCEALTAAWEGGISPGREAWGKLLRQGVDAGKAELESWVEGHKGKFSHPLHLVHETAKAAGPDATIVADGGDIMTWSMLGLPANGPGRLLTTGVYLGCLGVGIPFALAAKAARPDRPVALISGDGTFGLNAMEFDTAVRHDLPIVAVVSCEGSWGMSRHGQERGHGRTVATELGMRPYDEVVKALGGHGEWVDEPEEVRPAIDRAFESGKPACVNVAVDPKICSPLTELMASLGIE